MLSVVLCWPGHVWEVWVAFTTLYDAPIAPRRHARELFNRWGVFKEPAMLSTTLQYI
jgi:hypothetical protein